MSRYLVVELGNTDAVTLKFAVRDTELANLWLQKMARRGQWAMDDATRFYGFDSDDQSRAQAQYRLLQCVETINHYQKIITRPFSSIDDQDYLNYLHHIFEVYHGLLDQQHSEFWRCAPPEVRRALADLNVAVHRSECIARGNPPRFVCTWFGMPKTDVMTLDQIRAHGDTRVRFGGVYLNYVEIGKTLEHLAEDQDQYISQDAFQPFLRYSADFFVSFYDRDYRDQLDEMQHYLQQHRDFFESQGIDQITSPLAMPYRFPVADLVDSRSATELLDLIAQRQYIKQVTIL